MISKRDSKPDIDLSKIFDKMPPNAYEAECALLGSMILDSQVIGDVVQIIADENDFYKASHGVIYKTLIEFFERGTPLDMVHIKQRLSDASQLTAVGGVEYLIELVESVPSALSASYYARIVRDKAVLRGLVKEASSILHAAYHDPVAVDEQLDKAEQSIFDLRRNDGSQKSDLLKLLVIDAMERIDASDGKPVTGLETGYIDLDNILTGLHDGEMIIVAARPSMGKTMLALNMAEYLAVVNNVPVALFSLEMGKAQLAERLLASNSGVDSQKIRKRMLSGDDYQALGKSTDILSNAPLYINDTPSMSVLSLRAEARRLVARYGVKVVFIDYLQLMTDPGKENRLQEVSSISRNVKALARDLNLPVVCLSQLNRASENRDGNKPRMADLRESGSIEQDADVVMFLHREDYYERLKNPDHQLTNEAEIIVAKQRNGPVDTIKLHYDGPRQRFRNLDFRHFRPDQGVSVNDF